MVNTIEQHVCNGYNRFFMSAALLNMVITDFKVRTLFTFDCSIRTLTNKGLMYTPARETRTDFFFPALSLFCGVSPVQEYTCLEEGKTGISGPISASIAIAVKISLMLGKDRMSWICGK